MHLLFIVSVIFNPVAFIAFTRFIEHKGGFKFLKSKLFPGNGSFHSELTILKSIYIYP